MCGPEAGPKLTHIIRSRAAVPDLIVSEGGTAVIAKAVLYEAICVNDDTAAQLKLSVSLSPLWSGRYLAHITAEQEGRRSKSWSRQVRSGRGLFLWVWWTCAERARVHLTDNAFGEMTDEVWRTDAQLGKEFLAAQVELLIGSIPTFVLPATK